VTPDELVLALCRERVAQGLTQEEVGLRMGRSTYRSVQAWESGKTMPVLVNFVDWADALDIDVELKHR